jgi:hypothetical protein
MDSFCGVFTLLTSEPGILAYHLVLAFSILAAYKLLISHRKTRLWSFSRRSVRFSSLWFIRGFWSWLAGVIDRLAPPPDRTVL